MPHIPVARVQWLVVCGLVWLLAINVAMAQDDDGGETADEADMDEEGEDEKMIPDEEPNGNEPFHRRVEQFLDIYHLVYFLS